MLFLGDEPTVPEPDSATSDPVLHLDLDCEVALGVVEDNKNGIRKLEISLRKSKNTDILE